jgi:hypothetical protein
MKASKELFKVTMFFPLTDNEGNLFDQDTWGWWRDEITNVIAAFTDLGVVTGWWHGHSDRNRWILAVVRGEVEIAKLRNFLRRARLWFRQDAMYFEWHPVNFELVR